MKIRLYKIILLTSVFLTVLASGAIANEYRAFWVDAWHSGFLNQSQVDTLLGVPGNASSLGAIRNANCNAVFVQVRLNANVCYPSGMGEPYFTSNSFNALKSIIQAAHDTTSGKKRIEVHCWVVVFRTAGGTVYSQHSSSSNPDNYWPTQDYDGNENSDKAFDPGHPKCEEYLVNVCMDLVQNFDIDGLHFDYIRFTANDEGYNPTSVARYNTRYGTTGKPDSSDEQFKQWRRDQITAFVRKVYAKIQTVKPSVKLSGAFVTWNNPPSASTRAAFMDTRPYYDVYSDWDSWMQEGIVDIAVPMNYYDNAYSSDNYTQWMDFIKDRKANRLAVIGPGIYMNYLQDAIDQILATRDASSSGNYADGFCGYSYACPYAVTKYSGYGSWDTFEEQLTSQVTPTWTDIPAMPWKVSPTKGHISGTVTYYPSGNWADGAYVQISGPESRTQYCDGTGFYAFIDLIPGTYTVKINYGTYEEIKTVTVTAGQMTVADSYQNTTDTTSPVISSVSISDIGDSSARISWNTDDFANGQVEFDQTLPYGRYSSVSTTLTLDHSITITGLTPSTVYRYRVKSTNNVGLTSYSSNYYFTTAAASTGTIVDDLDPECSSSGNWSPGTSSGGYDGGYEYASANSSSETATYTWTPVIPRTGPYNVYVWYREGSNRTTAAKYTIVYAGGSMIYTANQQSNGQAWVKAASNLQFNAGSSGYVKLSNLTSTGNVVVADAVKFEYASDITGPVMTSVTDDKYTSSTTSLNASWSGYDNESGISRYEYALGTQAGYSDVKAWTSAGAATSITITGLSLTCGQTYYISVRAVNGTSLTSIKRVSSGVTVTYPADTVTAAKVYANGTPVTLPVRTVTAVFSGYFYIEDSNRTSGIRIDSTTSVTIGQSVQVSGILSTVNGERKVISSKVLY